jgi:hypothetical protein
VDGSGAIAMLLKKASWSAPKPALLLNKLTPMNLEAVADCLPAQTLPAKASIVFHSSGVKLSFAAATFSSKCAIEDVPGIGSIAGDRWRSQARATWIVLAL